MQTIVKSEKPSVRTENEVDLSIVIPVFNEADNVAPLHAELSMEISKITKNYEIIYVDDGSDDGTQGVLEHIFDQDDHVRVIQHRRNFGQTSAISSGMLLASGKVVVTMDADLQNDPSDIIRLVRKLDEGYDLVSGWRLQRDDPYLSKRLPSKVSNWLARKLVQVKIHDFGCTLKAYKRESLQNLEIYGDQHRYIPALVAAEGFRMTELPVNHRKRYKGKSKYGVSRLVKGVLDLSYLAFWIRYSRRPLHFFGSIGLLLIFLGVLITGVKLGQLIIFRSPLDLGPLLLFASISAVAGLQLILFGFLGEIQVRTYYQTSKLNADRLLKRVLSR